MPTHNPPEPKTTEEKKHNLQMNTRNSFAGAGKRNDMMKNIIQMAKEMLPMNQKEFINIVAFNTNLTTRKISEDYVDLLISVGIIQCNKFDYELGRNSGNV